MDGRPIDFCHAPREGERTALVIRDWPDACEPVVAAYDVGRAYLIGIRCFRLPVDAEALATWIAGAHAEGLEVRDERAPGDHLAQADLANARQQAQHDLARHLAQRQARRAAEPPPAGGLFDFTARDQGELF